MQREYTQCVINTSCVFAIWRRKFSATEIRLGSTRLNGSFSHTNCSWYIYVKITQPSEIKLQIFPCYQFDDVSVSYVISFICSNLFDKIIILVFL